MECPFPAHERQKWFHIAFDIIKYPNGSWYQRLLNHCNSPTKHHGFLAVVELWPFTVINGMITPATKVMSQVNELRAKSVDVHYLLPYSSQSYPFCLWANQGECNFMRFLRTSQGYARPPPVLFLLFCSGWFIHDARILKNGWSDDFRFYEHDSPLKDVKIFWAMPQLSASWFFYHNWCPNFRPIFVVWDFHRKPCAPPCRRAVKLLPFGGRPTTTRMESQV